MAIQYKIYLNLALEDLTGVEKGQNDTAPHAEIVLATKSLTAKPDTSLLTSYIDDFRSASSTFNLLGQPLNGKMKMNSTIW